MDPLLRSTLLKVAMPLIAIVVVLFMARKRGLSWRNDLGFQAPTIAATFLWLAVWVAWMYAGERIIDAFDLGDSKAWPDYPKTIVALRILAIGILGPIAEEVVARGLFLTYLRRTRLGTAGAVVVTALAWAAAHFDYSLGTIALITADGLLLGTARVRGRSLWLPIAMHMIGNLFSIWQSLHA